VEILVLTKGGGGAGLFRGKFYRRSSIDDHGEKKRQSRMCFIVAEEKTEKGARGGRPLPRDLGNKF